MTPLAKSQPRLIPWVKNKDSDSAEKSGKLGWVDMNMAVVVSAVEDEIRDEIKAIDYKMWIVWAVRYATPAEHVIAVRARDKTGRRRSVNGEREMAQRGGSSLCKWFIVLPSSDKDQQLHIQNRTRFPKWHCKWILPLKSKGQPRSEIVMPGPFIAGGAFLHPAWHAESAMSRAPVVYRSEAAHLF